MGHIYFFQCLEGFGKFRSSGAIINWADFVMIGDLLLSWKISSDMSNISNTDRDPSWNASWDQSLQCWSSNCCMYVTDFVMFDSIFL